MNMKKIKLVQYVNKKHLLTETSAYTNSQPDADELKM